MFFISQFMHNFLCDYLLGVKGSSTIFLDFFFFFSFRRLANCSSSDVYGKPYASMFGFSPIGPTIFDSSKLPSQPYSPSVFLYFIGLFPV